MKRRMMKRLWALMTCIAVGVSMTMLLPVVTPLRAAAVEYDPNAAIAYAHKYALNYNPDYHNFNPDGGDCANFVSQCLYAGGLQMTDGWYYYSTSNRSASWTGCTSMYNYFQDAGYEIIENPSENELIPGNVVLYWSKKYNTWSHAAIIVENDGAPKVAAHNDDHLTADWKLGNDWVKRCTILINGTLPPPTYAKLDNNQVWYDLKDEIILTPSSDHAVDFFISIRKDNQTVASDHVNRGEAFRYPAEQFGAGNYYAWISAANSAGSVDSEGIDFSIVDGVGYSNVYTSKSAYSVNDDVSVTVDTICAKGQVIGIDKIGEGRKITENCDSTFSVPAKNLGTGLFGAYFSVYNGSQSIDTKWDFFSIDNETEKPKSAELKADKKNYALEDKITLSPSSTNALVYWLGVRKDGKDIINTKITGDYSFNANDYGKGEYYGWISAVNSCGSTDSEGICFFVETTATKGDVNDDGSVDLKDVTVMRRKLAGWEVTVNETAADVNKDGSFDLKDVVTLRRYLAGGWNITL